MDRRLTEDEYRAMELIGRSSSSTNIDQNAWSPQRKIASIESRMDLALETNDKNWFETLWYFLRSAKLELEYAEDMGYLDDE